ncbi:class I SAM-dependent methyltransferase [Halomonas sabkhae]|uniref:class I SAM-dependent methyltransferase n=1 Tax=Halomonas sabkhae TaxID=626223 RepID=UPI0025B303DB|nr:class I SAM-dependent methyltransferase [Halomonas sabkhae]MDN3524288.1 class I SAM-dependent methyltransferase [Halomonas sabkhae]
MKAETPVCQLLQRQSTDYRDWLWVGPPGDSWLESAGGHLLSADRVRLHDWQTQGGVAGGPFAEDLPAPAGVVLFWPKAHALGEWWLLWLCARLEPGTPLQVVGEHQGGIKRVLKVLAALGLGCRKLDSARRCSLFASQLDRVGIDPDAAWQQFEAAGLDLVSHPGVFGHGKLDDGTRLLLSQLDACLPEQGAVLDMGCGDGILAAWLARRGLTVTAVDVNGFAVEATRRTLAANDLVGEVCHADLYAGLGDRRFQAIVSNPPFHQERAVDHGPAGRLIAEAPEHLEPGGQLLMVANAFLPYPDLLERAFGGFEILADDQRFRVYRAVKRRAAPGPS